MEEMTNMRPGLQIRRFSSHEEQRRETARFWNAQSIDYKMSIVAELVHDAYMLRGIDIDAQRPDRSVRGVQRARS